MKRSNSVTGYRQLIEQITTGKPVKDYIDFERQVIDTIQEVLDCGNGDAQGILEASSYNVMKGYNEGLTAEEVAHDILYLRYEP